MAEPLPYGRQWVDEDDLAAVAEVLRSDFLTTGPAVGAFEKALQRATGARHAVAVSSGTSALHAAYSAIGLRAGDEIITSPLTFAATTNAALYLGARVRFVDVDPETGNIDPALVASAINERTRAVVAIDFAGHPADYDALRAITEHHELKLVADAAHSLGARYRGRTVGTLADVTGTSFHPVKPVTTAEGGAVLTQDQRVAHRALRFRTHGITKDRSELEHPDEGGWWYEQHALGFNYRLTDLQAALGTSQLQKLPRFLERRRAIAARYQDAFSDLSQLMRPVTREDVESGWHLYVLRTRDPELRRPLFDALRARGIGVQVHYIPVYWHPYYRDLGFRKGLCAKAESFYRSALSLPIFPRMTEDDVARVIDTVHRCLEEVDR